jgi:P-type Ca2+ transporter type 2C
MSQYTNWHAHSVDDVLKNIGVTRSGLSLSVAERKLAREGKNILPQKKSLSKTKLFLAQFNSPLMYILLITVIISFLLSHFSDSIFILVVILANTIMGFYQENKANNSLEVLKQMVKIKTKVLRNGNKVEIDSENLVQGDIIFLRAGDEIPADSRIIESKTFKVNEASLTGEWLSVEKNNLQLSKDTIIGDRANMVFMGTSVDMGEAKAVVVAVGLKSEFGKIVSLVTVTEEPKTPLQKAIVKLSRLVGAFILFLGVAIVMEGIWRGRDFVEIFITALALVVSAIPEGLLPAITVILILAMRRILKNKGVVKRLSAAEALGSVTVVCTDKTGTLTEGNMEVSHVLTSTTELLSKNSSFVGGINLESAQSDILAIRIATLTNEAYIENPKDELHEWIIRGFFTDKALLKAGLQAGIDVRALEKKWKLIDKISFSSRSRFGASLREVEGIKKLLVVGAPEELILRATQVDFNGKQLGIESSQSKKMLKKIESFTKKGLRVVACAYRDVERVEYEKLSDLVQELTLVGFIAIKDPVRADVKNAMEEIQIAGIHPIIITGDHRLTAKAVAEEVGLKVGPNQILEGKDVEKMSVAILAKKVKEVVIFARALPEHKLKIMQALHRNGEVVAMFGDGINDAPALKAADISVAVGSGTDVAKEVADIILLDNNFKTIVKAIEQGRVAFGNIRKVLVYLTADNFSAIFLFLGAMIFGLPLPLLAAQILWINLAEDTLPNMALTSEQETEGVMKESPRNSKEPILSGKMKKWMATIFLVNGLVTFLFFYYLYQMTGNIEKARTLVFALMVFDSLVFAYSLRSFKKVIFRKDIFSNRFLNGAVFIGLVLLFAGIYAPILQNLLGTVALCTRDWLLIFSLAVFETMIIEVSKVYFLSERKRKRT